MGKYFIYEFKRNFNAIAIFSAILAIVVFALNLSCRIYVDYGNAYIADYIDIYFLEFIYFTLLVASAVVTFSFLYKRQTIDQLYSLPISRQKLIAVRLIVGFLLAIIPFTVGYFVSFFQLHIKFLVYKSSNWNAISIENSIRLINERLSLYLVCVVFGATFYSVCSFFVAMANNETDGIIFIIFSFLMVYLPIVTLKETVNLFFNGSGFNKFLNNNIDIGRYTTISPIFDAFNVYGKKLNYFSVLIRNGLPFNGEDIVIDNVLIYRYPVANYFDISNFLMVIIAVLCVLGVIFIVPKKKAEFAGGISEWKFGYEFFIPFYSLFVIYLMNISSAYNDFISNTFLVFIATLVAYFFYRRKLKLEKRYWIQYAITCVSGLVIYFVFNFPFI